MQEEPEPCVMPSQGPAMRKAPNFGALGLYKIDEVMFYGFSAFTALVRVQISFGLDLLPAVLLLLFFLSISENY
jgi:hypothetical protein